MSLDDIPLGFGTYLVVIEDYHQGKQNICSKGEIALVFSKHRSANKDKPYDLLIEKGNTLFGVKAGELRTHFRAVYHDPDVVIDGCSTNHGWDIAKQNARRFTEDKG